METAKDRIVATLKGIIADVYQIDAQQVNEQASFLEMGLDSITIIQVKQLVKNAYGFDIAVDRLFGDVNTLDALAGYVMEKLPSATTEPVRVVPSSRATGPTAPIPATGPVARPAATDAEASMRQIINDQILIMHRQMEMLARMNS